MRALPVKFEIPRPSMEFEPKCRRNNGCVSFQLPLLTPDNKIF
ncbi:MAG: hypothetical protein ACFFCG_13000 [Promethearchaeota archaeon]